MTDRNAQLLDLYSDYRVASFGQTTATGLTRLVTDLSHARVTQFLEGQERPRPLEERRQILKAGGQLVAIISWLCKVRK